MYLPIIISTIALVISIFLAVRLLLLDKDYCEFSIIDRGGNNNGLSPYTSINSKIGYIPTCLRPKIQIFKSDIYDLNIIPNLNFIGNISTNNIGQLKCNSIISFNGVITEPITFTITYRDSKNNLYEQYLNIKPHYNGSSKEETKSWSINLTNRKWLFIKSLKRKYF